MAIKKLNWDQTIVWDGVVVSLEDWLREQFPLHRTPDLTRMLERAGITTTSDAVRAKARRMGIFRISYKGDAGDVEPRVPGSATERVSVEEETNVLNVRSSSPRIRSLEQLVKVCQIDLSVWECASIKHGYWEGFAKHEEKDLTWASGVMDGWQKASGVIVEPLYRMEARFVRIQPVMLFPTLQPIEPVFQPYAMPPAYKKGVRRALIFGDPHFGFRRRVNDSLLTPFHDRAVLDLMLQLACAADVTEVHCVGDQLDAPMWTSRFIRSPEFYFAMQPALLECFWWFSQLRASLPDVPITLHEGNHERRFRDAIMVHLPAAYGLRAVDEMDMPPALSPQRLLGLHKLGIEWVEHYPSDEHWLNDNLKIVHGDVARKGPGKTAGAVAKDSDTSVVFGHSHRLELASWTRHLRGERRTVQACSIGCLCRTDGVVPGAKANYQWQNGCALVDYDEDGGFSICPVRMEDGGLLWNGMAFEALDRLPEIRKAYPDWNWGK